MDLITSHGYETSSHKSFMRITSLISGIIFYLSSLIYHTLSDKKLFRFSNKLSLLLLTTCSPLLILIDHGHFQYNCVMSGLVLWALILIENKQFALAGVLFIMAINFKILALYYSIAFFAYYLGYFLKQKNYLQSLLRIAFIALAMISTLILLWWPWLKNTNTIKDVLNAIFPL